MVNDVKNHVYNKTFGKIVRTLGFLLILAASLFIVTQLILENEELPLIGVLTPFAIQIDQIIQSQPMINDYVGLGLILGFLLITWAIAKSMFLKVLVTVVLLFFYVEGILSGTSPIAPIILATPDWFRNIVISLEPFVIQLSETSPYVVPGVALSAPMLLWFVFNKKPSRLSLYLARIATTTLFLAILLQFFGSLIPIISAMGIAEVIRVALYIIVYLAFVASGALGVLGFGRK